jgi:sarcosine oxidase subunit beta
MKKIDCVIIGGGVIGLSTAYNLGINGFSKVVVIEKKFVGYGASGRCGGGVRQQWSTMENILLAKKSVEIFEKLSSELEINIWFNQGGYLFLSYSEKEYEDIQKAVKLQNSMGVPTILLSEKETKDRYPYLDLNGVVGASYCQTDGTVFPFPVIWGYSEKSKSMGIEIHEKEEVIKIEKVKDYSYKVTTDKEVYETSWIINAAGAWSPRISSMLGITIPNKPYRHEIIVTEPIKLFLEPMVVSLKTGLYMSQSMRGEVIGGINMSSLAEDYSMIATSDFLKNVAREFTTVIPRLSNVRVMRQWAGLYDETPDGKPLIGEEENFPGFVEVNGFGGHGFMLSPMVGVLASSIILKKKTIIPIELYNPDRFKKGVKDKESFSLG